jgi:hypothetical protein
MSSLKGRAKVGGGGNLTKNLLTKANAVRELMFVDPGLAYSLIATRF